MTFGNWKGDKFVPAEDRSVTHTEELAQAMEELQAAINRVDQMGEEIERLRADLANANGAYAIACAEIERLREYADHKPNCRVGYGMYCTCGFLRALGLKP